MSSQRLYCIRVEGCLPSNWKDWLGGMQIISDGNESILICHLCDICALYGVLNHLGNLNINLISINSIEYDFKTDSTKEV